MFLFGSEEEQTKRKEDLEKVAEFNTNSISHHLEYGLISTDLLLEAYEMIDSFTSGEAVMYAAIRKLRTITENALYWIQKNNGKDPHVVTSTHENEDNQL